MIQDAKNPIQFGEKLTREFADPTIFLNLQPSLYVGLGAGVLVRFCSSKSCCN